MPSADLDLLPPPRRPHPDLARPRLPGPTPDQPVVLAVALPGSGRSTWLHQVVDRFGGPLIATTVVAAPGVAVHLTATGPAREHLATGAAHDDLWGTALDTARRWPGAVLLGIDDLHRAPPEAVAEAAPQVARIVRAQGRVAITARRRPGWPLSAGRVAGWLREVDDQELAFTVDELAELADLPLDAGGEVADRVHELHRLTAGWATGAEAAARAIRQGGPRTRVATGGVASHLAELVLADLDPADHPALLVASVLPSASVPLVHAVGGAEVARRFADLRVHHPALVGEPVDADRSTVPTLLARGLRAHADAADPSALEVLARAAEWHRQEGLLREPVELLLAAHRWAEATALLVATAPRFAGEDRHQEFLQLWDRLPPPAWEADPLAVLTAALLRAGAGRAASAYDLLVRPPITDFDLPPGTRLVAQVIEALLAPWSLDPVRTLAAAELALLGLEGIDEAALAPVLGLRARDPWRHLALLGAARAELVLGRWPAAVRRLGALDHDQSVGAMVRLGQAASLARALALCGRLPEAAAQADRAVAEGSRLGVPEHPTLLDARLARAEVALGRNDLADAVAIAEAAAQQAEGLRCATQLGAARAVQATAALRRGRPDEALELVGGVGPLPDGHPRAALDALRVRALHRTGAAALARELAAVVPVTATTVSAHAEVTGGDLRHLVGPHLLPDDPAEAPVAHTSAALVRALSRHRADANDAWVHLSNALDVAEPHGLLGPFAELPAALMSTFEALPATSPFGATAVDVARRGRTPDGEVLVLTPTELAVLAALAGPRSLPEVAEELFVSTNTLKTHTRSIYRKLRVTSRADAVATGRRLGLP